MKKTLFVAIMAGMLVFSGCTRTGGQWRISPGISLTPPVLTIVVTNNTIYPLSFSQNGEPVMAQHPATKQWQDLYVLPGGTVSRGYYSFMGSRDIVLTARATCPVGGVPSKPGEPNTGCNAGQYVGTESRRFYVYSGSDYRTENWEINYVRLPRGSY